MLSGKMIHVFRKGFLTIFHTKIFLTSTLALPVTSSLPCTFPEKKMIILRARHTKPLAPAERSARYDFLASSNTRTIPPAITPLFPLLMCAATPRGYGHIADVSSPSEPRFSAVAKRCRLRFEGTFFIPPPIVSVRTLHKRRAYTDGTGDRLMMVPYSPGPVVRSLFPTWVA